jgi:ABC-type Co2+ transport system permease subunit
MASTFTQNKNIEQPASGSYDNAWAAPVNADWEIIDTAFGGVTVISVTGVTGPSVEFTTAQYTPPTIEFTGTLSANLLYYLPSDVGGMWSVVNGTTGAFSLTIGIFSSGVTIPQGERALITSDGLTVSLSNTYVPNVEEGAVLAWQAALAIQGSQIQSVISAAYIPALTASYIVSGTFAAARIPLAGTLPGITIAPDPGTTPSGTYGDIFYYY